MSRDDAGDFPLVHESLPPIDSVEQPAAVVFLHGRGADERDLLGLRDRLPEAVHVLSVRAPEPLGPGYTWYELDLSGGGLHASQPDTEDFRRSRRLLDEFVEKAIETYGLDSDRIGLFGFSQGGILALTSILERPDRFAWAVALHAYLPETVEPVDDRTEWPPVFMGAGEHDDIIPKHRSVEAAERLEATGVPVTFRVYPLGHSIGQEELHDVSEWIAEQLAG